MLTEELKPMDIGQILDKTFRLTFLTLKKNLKLFLIYCGIFLAISTIITGITIGIFFLNNWRIDRLESSENLYTLFFYIPLFIIFSIIILVAVILYGGMVIDIFIKAFLGEEWNMKSSLKYVRSKFWVMVFSGILCYFILIAGYLMCCIGILPMMTFISLVFPAILAEDLKSFNALGRSFKLVSYGFWRVFGSILLFDLAVWFSSMIVMYGLMIAPMILFSINKFNESNILMISVTILISVISAVLYIASIILINALSTAFHVLLFFNQKIKFEKYGVELLVNTLVNENNGNLAVDNQLNNNDNNE